MARAPIVTSKSLLDEIGEDFLSCSICLEIYKKPTVLPCLHTYCQQCLVDFKAKSGGVLKCARCRIQCDTPIQELKSNFFLTSLLDTFQRQKQLNTDHPPVCEACQEKTATHRCVDCPQFCCDVCVTIHERFPALRSHEVITIDKYREIESKDHLIKEYKVFCSDHKDSHLEFYCDTCQVPVCLKCTIVNHKAPEHIHNDLKIVVDEYKTQLRKMLEQLKVKEKQVEEEKASAESTVEKMRNECEAEKAKVKKRAKEVIERVKREEKMLIDALDETSRLQLKDATMKIDEMQFHHGNIVSTHHYLDTLVHHGNAVHLLHVSTKLETKKRIKEMVAMEIKPPIIHNSIEFHPGSDLATHALMGVIQTEACQSKCTVENIPKLLVEGESVNLLITTRDSKGNQIIANQFVNVKTKNRDASWEDIDVTDNKDGTCHVKITGKMEGKQQIAMTIVNQHLPGSPFHIPVYIRGLAQTVGNAGQGQFNNPKGITMNKHGDYVTADQQNKRVAIHDRDGNYKQSFTFSDQFAKPFIPCDVAISDKNEYFITDESNKQIVVSNENGRLIRKFGSSEMNQPAGIAINPVNKNIYVTINSKGIVYVSDAHIGSVQVFNSDDQFMFEISSMSSPRGVAVDKNDNVYVSSVHKVTKYDSHGQFICRIDSDKDGLSSPYGVAVCNDGRIAVADYGNNCIKVFVE
uniref:Tripartite motif-containing protein 2-like n=1 Tax=Saccoglossus kowalevskii TaxID=10224 RepID=A0ABM0GUL9_SACKO|nr:PREDICTED: tripartite motif-containing protein 2-like [Saccoglossus kowalevskii]